MRNPVAWGLAAVLAAVVLIGIGLLGARLRPYWVAKYRGERAELQGVVLVFGPFQGANLIATKLQGANLGGSNLETANLYFANLQRANLRGVNLRGAYLAAADLRGADLRGADLTTAYVPSPGSRQMYFPKETFPQILRQQAMPGGSSYFTAFATRLTGARYDALTRWPKGFDPLKHGAILVK